MLKFVSGADHAYDLNTKTGYFNNRWSFFFTFCGGVITWPSQRHKSVTTSNTKANVMVASVACRYCLA